MVQLGGQEVYAIDNGQSANGFLHNLHIITVGRFF
jgi:hypothetical protein